MRTPEGRRGRSRRGGRRARRTDAPSADLDDVLCVHPGGCPAGSRNGSSCRNAAVTGHGGTVLDVGRDLVWSSFFHRLLSFHTQFWPRPVGTTIWSTRAPSGGDDSSLRP